MAARRETGQDRLFVAVVGSGEADPELDVLAEEVGRGLAEGGAVVVCGGLGGVMAAACRGAAAADGLTIGLLPGDDPRAANPWVLAPVATGLGELRNGLVVRSSDAVVAVGGGYGTLSEVALALKLGRPVVGLRTFAVSRPDGTPDGGVTPVDGSAAAVSLALALGAANRVTRK
ncbi:MAG TPA: TIGR00725 family protein [Acidimicrobiales bacterium]|nr:TIGR00725 family protein [Acidimicrobiales bacterium]